MANLTTVLKTTSRESLRKIIDSARGEKGLTLRPKSRYLLRPFGIVLGDYGST